MAKPIVDLTWAQNNVSDPVSGQANKAEQSTAMKQNGWSSDQYPPFNWFNYWMNGVWQWITCIGEGYARPAEYVIASSDSPSNDQNGADLIIQTTADAGALINAIMTSISSAGGGTVKLTAGTFYLSTTIVAKTNVTLTGSGANTILIRNSATLVTCLNTGSVSGCHFSNFVIDGSSTVYQVANAVGIASATGAGNLNQSFTFIKVRNQISAVGTGSTFFSGCQNMVNCVAECLIGPTREMIGFGNCSRLVNCWANLTNTSTTAYNLTGFLASNYLSNCRADLTGDPALTVYGFRTSNDISSCFANISQGGTNYGFWQCFRISSSRANISTATVLATGFENCQYITSCEAQTTSAGTANSYGFNGCRALSVCNASATASGTGLGYGYRTCIKVVNTFVSLATTFGYKTCSADFGGAVPISNPTSNDTAALGWNTGTGQA